MTLLERAKKEPVRKGYVKPDRETIELALAWARDEITLSQCKTAMKGEKAAQMTAYVSLARGLREAVRQGILKC
jgi:hypothetical protein